MARGPIVDERALYLALRDEDGTLSSRRVETFVTNGAPSELKASGRGLELTPVTHPNDLYAGEAITFKLTDNGKPAAKAK